MRKQAARRCGDIALAHQTFADEKRRNAGLREPRKIGGSEYAALADNNAAGRNPAGKPLAGRERRLEGFQVPVVDAEKS